MTTQLPLVSVILPVYNHERFVGEALDSVFQQSYPHLALVVVDDGSEDRSPALVEKKLEKSPHPYQFLRQDNQGAHAAINAAIERAEGDYIAILNSDDVYHPERVDRVVRRLRESPAQFAYSQVKHIDAEGNPLTTEDPFRFYYVQSLEDAGCFPTPTFELVRHNITVSTGNFIFHRDLYCEVGPFRAYETCHDWDYVLRVIRREEPLFVREALYEYRIHGQSTLQSREDVREEEIGQVISSYLAAMGNARNPLAPSPKNWGAYWDLFATGYMGHFQTYEGAWNLLGQGKGGVDLSDRMWRGIEKGSRVLNRALKGWGDLWGLDGEGEGRLRRFVYRALARVVTGLFSRG